MTQVILNKSFSCESDFHEDNSDKDKYSNCEFLAIFPLYQNVGAIYSPRVENSSICSLNLWGKRPIWLDCRSCNFFDCVINDSTFRKVKGKGNKFYGSIIYDEQKFSVVNNDNTHIFIRRKSDAKVFKIEKAFRYDSNGFSSNMVISNDGTWTEWVQE